MNFKTPFKVLTTAALIGTLSLSAVAPGAASAATNTTVSAKAEVAQDIKSVVLKKGDDSITLSYNDYASAQGSKVLDGYVVTHVVADNGAVYDYETYGLAYSKGATTTEVFKKLADAEASTTEVPAEAKEASFNEDGELVVSTPTEEDFKVTEIAAINSTTIEIKTNKSVTAEDGYTFTIDGDQVEASKITYGEKKITISVDPLVDDQEYTVAVKDAEDKEVKKQVVSYDFNIPTELTASASTINATVGEEASVTYTLVDEDGDAIKDQDVRVQAKDTDSKVVKEEVLKTNAEGKVIFKYSTIDTGKHTVEAVVVSKPTVRKSVNVDWAASSNQIVVQAPEANGFVVDTATNVADENKTIKYTVKFTDEKGQPLADGTKVAVNLDGLATTTTVTTAGEDEFVTSSSAGKKFFTKTLDNGDGTAVLEFTSDEAAKITPTFYVTEATNLGDVESTDARVEAKQLEVVDASKQKPTYTLELKSGKNDNVGVTEKDGKLSVETGKAAQYKLTAKDQYGNPFIGTAKLSHNVKLDNVASNDNEIGTIKFDIDELDGGYTSSSKTEIDFSVTDVNGDGVVEFQVSNGTNNDKTKFTIWTDVNSNNKLDASEGVESKEITFVEATTKKVASIEAKAAETTIFTTAAPTFTVKLKGEDGKAFDATLTQAQQVLVVAYKDGKKVSTTPTTATVNAANGEATVSLAATTATDAGSKYYVEVYLDVNKDGVLQSDETIKAKSDTVDVNQTPDTLKVELADKDVEEITAGSEVELKVSALVGTAVASKFNGKFDVKVLLAADTGNVNEADKTYIRTIEFKDGVATVKVPANLVVNNNVKVTLVDVKNAGIPLTADIDAADDANGDINVVADEASKLVADTTTTVTDKFGNLVADYNKSGVATIEATDASVKANSANLELDAEGKALVKIVDGVLKDGTNNIVLAGTSTEKNGKVVVTFADGTSFTADVAKATN